jgi:heme/copper-type cytochrome/quinol oxidase subunit 2
MPITVRAVNDADFATWVEAEKKNAGLDNAPPTSFAAAGAGALTIKTEKNAR